MAIVSIKKALERHLNTLTPSIQTAYENVNFTPTPGTAFQYVQLIPRNPANPTLGDGYYREQGEFQVFLAYPLNQGSASALARAAKVQEHFKRGSVWIENDIRIMILNTPQIAGSTVTQDRLVVPVLISYIAEVHE